MRWALLVVLIGWTAADAAAAHSKRRKKSHTSQSAATTNSAKTSAATTSSARTSAASPSAAGPTAASLGATGSGAGSPGAEGVTVTSLGAASLGAAGVGAASSTRGSQSAVATDNKRIGRLRGSVGWAGRAPDFADEGCLIQEGDFAGHPEVTGGISHVVLIAEPLDSRLQQLYHHPPRKTGTTAAMQMALEWNSLGGPPTATALPSLPLPVRTTVPLQFFAGDKLVGTVPPSATDGQIVLPPGIIKIADDRGGVGWVYVTPYPARTSSPTCRFGFLLPPGRYRLHAWHPRAGERNLDVAVAATDRDAPVPQHAIIFGRP